MTSPLFMAWHRLVGQDDSEPDEPQGYVPSKTLTLAIEETSAPEAGILLVLRRLRIPLIIVIGIFAISVLGLIIIPGTDGHGNTTHLSLFDAFYFVSYTALTIGFGEINPLTTAQRMWVTLSIYMSVIGWAYGIGSLLSLTQDQAFRRTLARRHVTRKVRRSVEPFLILIGYGPTMRSIARALDELGRRFVVLDTRESRVSAVDLDAYKADTPALLGNARDTRNLVLAGLAHPRCEGVIALTNDDRTNLDVTMTTALLRPGLPIISSTLSRPMAARMQSFDDCEVINGLDRFGDHLRIMLRSPAGYQLMVWLTSAPGSPLPPRREVRPDGGRWVVYGRTQFAIELRADLEAEGVPVTVIDKEEGHGIDDAELETAFAFVAAGADDTGNIWALEAVRRVNPDLFTVALEHAPANVPLFEALKVDFGMTPSQLMTIEVMARLAHPALMRLLPKIPRLGNDWSQTMLDRLVERCGEHKADLWRVYLDADDAPAVQPWLDLERLTVGDLQRDPLDRDRMLRLVPLLLLRDGQAHPGPPDDTVLRPTDELLLAAHPGSRQALDTILSQPAAATYVIEGRSVPTTWVWRKLRRGRPGPTPEGADRSISS